MSKKLLLNLSSGIGEASGTIYGPKVAQDVSVLGNLLGDVSYDYIAMALSAGDTVETFTYREGGSFGTIVATVVVTYTNSTRDILVSVERTV